MQKIELSDLTFKLKLKKYECVIIRNGEKQVGFIPVCRGFDIMLTRWLDRLVLIKDDLIIASYCDVTSIEIDNVDKEEE